MKGQEAGPYRSGRLGDMYGFRALSYWSGLNKERQSDPTTKKSPWRPALKQLQAHGLMGEEERFER